MAKKDLTPCGRVMAALHGDIPVKTPFTMYEANILYEADGKLKKNTLALCKRGLCLYRKVRSYVIHHPNVKRNLVTYTDVNGRYLEKTVYITPVGEVSEINEPVPGLTSWPRERMFKSPDDYKTILYIIKDSVIAPNYKEVLSIQRGLGDNYVVRDSLPYEPLQALISNYMGTERYCMEWMDNRDEIMKLYEALADVAREIYAVAAESPLEVVKYGGNVVPSIIGVENFKKYYMPHYADAAEYMHRKGKLIGTHLDADNTLIMDAVAETDLDFIEAYDPVMSPPVKEARSKWPDKTLWINWPSAYQLEPRDQVYTKTIALLEEAAPGNNFILGIHEDIPDYKIIENLEAMMDAVEDYDYGH